MGQDIFILLSLPVLTYSAVVTDVNNTCLYTSTDKSNRIASPEYEKLQNWTKTQCEAGYNGDTHAGGITCYDEDSGGKLAWKMECLSAGLLKTKYNVDCDENALMTSCKSNNSCLNGGKILEDESVCSKNPPDIKCRCPPGFLGNMCQYIPVYRSCKEYDGAARNSYNSCASERDPESPCSLSLANRFYRCGKAERDVKGLPTELPSCDSVKYPGYTAIVPQRKVVTPGGASSDTSRIAAFVSMVIVSAVIPVIC